MPVLIEEIMRPAEQGMSRPYLCRGVDGNLYFVKGLNTTRESQVHEWVCGHLGKAFGLPIPDFELVEIDKMLLREVQPEWQEIGSGLAFGSREVRGGAWFELANIPSVPLELRQDVLVFDYWIQNLDRTDFNTNLLWKEMGHELAVIDHNLAFDREFSPEEFLSGHLFRDHWTEITGDLFIRSIYDQRLAQALVIFQDVLASVPQEWYWHDEQQTVEANFDIEQIEVALTRCNNSEFWSI